MSNLKKIAPGMFELSKDEKMHVPGLIIGSEALFSQVDIEKPLEQVRNVASLPGIRGYSIAMPDIHWGYGFPIGGVAAMNSMDGVISPGGVGYDINCGVRLAVASITYQDLSVKIEQELIQALFKKVPSGIGHGHKSKVLSDKEYDELLLRGVEWSVQQGYALPLDKEHIESYGCIAGADPDAVSFHAKERGRGQLGSIGSGNHFVELGFVEELFLPAIAEKWGVKKGGLYVLIHSGSRGFGHQVCQDTLDSFIKGGYAKGLRDPQLVAAPIQSKAGRSYFAAMAAAANYAFNNRQHILHSVREVLHEVLGLERSQVKLIYDVCHNIAKFEKYKIGDKEETLCVHRKGATRAFGPHSSELPLQFQETGQPVLVPGDMGRASHLLAGLGNSMTWCSCCHGAGRACSRVQSMRHWKGRSTTEFMKEQGVTVMGHSYRTIAEEMPDAYKNVDLVVEAVEEAQLAKRVARLRPKLVIKG